MEARLSKPVGGLTGEEVTVTATPDEWREVLVDIGELRSMFDSEGVDLETSTTNLVHYLAKVKVFI